MPTLLNFAYGGSKVLMPLVRRALDLLPSVGFVNAYGLTETSSTIAVLTPEDHRSAHDATDRAVGKRLGSVGRPVPGIEVQIRAADGTAPRPGAAGELCVRGEQVSGRYAEIGSVLDADGWFPPQGHRHLRRTGIPVHHRKRRRHDHPGWGEHCAGRTRGRADRAPERARGGRGGRRRSRMGQIIVAVVVPTLGTTADPDELREHVRRSLRGSCTPDRVVFRDRLPTSATGKVLRREIVENLERAGADGSEHPNNPPERS